MSDVNDIQNKTQVMSLYSQILTGLGFAVIIIGAVVLGMDLIAEFSGEDGDFELLVAIESAWLLFAGMGVAAAGQVLVCLRSIAVNCERMANTN